VLLVHTNYISIFAREALIKNLLPLSEKSIVETIEKLGGQEDWTNMPEVAHKKEFSQYLFEPSAEEVLDRVVPELIAVTIFQAILESRASEESSRMVAMKTASEQSQKLGDTLSLSYNRARQAHITREIIEITSSI